MAVVKSSDRTHWFGNSLRVIRAVSGSFSIAVQAVFGASFEGTLAMKSPVPQPGSSARPPRNPICAARSHIA
ncbi:hypothetical protein GCM10007870_25330 [Gluconobacter kondonii]|uniref:Uncharacterized protein n=1 Tax=Gluconobacter kondonii TaxID=941463 RepID=A0ABQ5WUN3_9PROT|nr:hypothetical protein AA3266_2382 [Gluconobacter kondonii NBRC 3266]GLQ66948.1 hypothetical protein GCM10007870_25330 [Gluconobacter kondonii]